MQPYIPVLPVPTRETYAEPLEEAPTRVAFRHEGLLMAMANFLVLLKLIVCLGLGATKLETMVKANLAIGILGGGLILWLTCAICWCPKGHFGKMITLSLMWLGAAALLVLWFNQ